MTDTIVQERRIAAAVDEVFHAFCDPDRLSRWMCPADGMRPATVSVDFRVGGGFEIVMHGTERDFRQRGEYLVIDPPKRLVFRWVSDFVPAHEADTRVTVTIEPDGAGCRVRLVHDELPATDTYDGHRAGWARILDLAAADWPAAGASR